MSCSMRAGYDPQSKGGPTFTDPEALKANLISYAQRDLVRRVFEPASDGYHQIGTTRMGSDPVNSDCRISRTSMLRRAAFLLRAQVHARHREPAIRRVGKGFRRPRDDARRDRSSRSSRHNLRNECRELPAA